MLAFCYQTLEPILNAGEVVVMKSPEALQELIGLIHSCALTSRRASLLDQWRLCGLQIKAHNLRA